MRDLGRRASAQRARDQRSGARHAARSETVSADHRADFGGDHGDDFGADHGAGRLTGSAERSGGLREAVRGWPYAVRSALVTGLIQLLVVITGGAPAPRLYQGVLTLFGAAALGLATARQLRTGPAAAAEVVDPTRQAQAVANAVRRRVERGRGSATAEELEQRWAAHVQGVDERWRHGGYPATEEFPRLDRPDGSSPRPARLEPPDPAWPSRIRLAMVAVASLALAALLWLPVGPAGRTAVSVATFLFGYAGYALPLVPPLMVGLLPPGRRDAVPWRRQLGQRRLARADLSRIAVRTLATARENLLTRPAGCLIALLGLLHLLRDAPGFADGGYRRAGGMVGAVVATPLSWVFSTSGAIGLLAGLIVSAALAGAAYLLTYRGRDWAIAGVVVLLVLPLGAAFAGRFFGYDYYLGASGDRVVVMAGVSQHARHPIRDSGVSTREVAVSARPLLVAGIPIADDDEGVRLARTLARPVAAKTFPADGGDLAAGQCFNSAGPNAQLRYPTPCEAGHFGEVYFIARVPYDRDPGASVVAATSRALCERSYSEYLGVPYGQSFLPIEPPLTIAGAWTPQPIVACWFRSIGTASVRGSKVVASLLQNNGWTPGPGCGATVTDSLTVRVDKPHTDCVAPGPSRPENISSGTLSVTTTLTVAGDYRDSDRLGVACLSGADARSGYYISVNPDGAITVWKQLAGARTELGTARPRRAAPVRVTVPFDLTVTCVSRPDRTGVDITAATSAATAKVSDQTLPVLGISPRLFIDISDTGPVSLTATSFSATLS